MTKDGVYVSGDMIEEDFVLKLLKKTTALLIVVLMFIGAVPEVFAAEIDAGFTEVNETVFAVSDVNIRTGPSTAYTKIGSLPFGNAVQRIAIGDCGWSKVIYDGEIAYIFSSYLSTTRPVISAPDVDYSKLTREIAIANGLKKADYTTESWEALSSALANATNALNSQSQDTVDKCEKALEGAVAGLAKVDRSALENVLDAVENFINSNEDNGQWIELAEAVDDGEELLSSNDQAAIEAAAAHINELLTAVQMNTAAQNTPEIITQEVQVEIPPVDDYCNISVHRVWPVLFLCSLVLNVVLAAVIVIYVYRKKKNQKDDTPLVDYDISDDIF